jgi:RNA polymerase-binding transcription factor
MLNQVKQRRRLERLLFKLGRRHEALGRGLQREEGQSEGDLAEQAGNTESDAVLACLQEEGEGQEALVRAALERMEAGTYGQCEDCEGVIPAARLQALPYAVTCIACARERERG